MPRKIYDLDEDEILFHQTTNKLLSTLSIAMPIIGLLIVSGLLWYHFSH